MPKIPPTNNADTTVNCHPDSVYFAQQVLPILVSHCALINCHNNETQQDGVNLTTYNFVMQTADVRPGNLNGSDLYEVITETDEDKRMPPLPHSPLNKNQIELIKKWILQGAKNLHCNTLTCDSTNIGYNKHIKPIFENNCKGCHTASNASVGINLDDYNGVKNIALNGRLLGAINHSAGYKPMPLGGKKLSDCEILQIKNWVDAGAPNN